MYSGWASATSAKAQRVAMPQVISFIGNQAGTSKCRPRGLPFPHLAVPVLLQLHHLGWHHLLPTQCCQPEDATSAPGRACSSATFPGTVLPSACLL